MVSLPPKSAIPVALLVATALIALGTGSATAFPEWPGMETKDWRSDTRAETPEDRFAMAGGCYVIRGAGAGYVVRDGDGFAASESSAAAAEPFHFQATDLGRYLLFATDNDFVAAGEGIVGQAAYGVTDSHPGQVVGGVALEQTDAAADTLADSEANRASGRGESVISAEAPGDLADWKIDEASDGTFVVTLPETDQALVVTEGGQLDLVDGPAGTPFAFELTTGCVEFPEIEVDVEGPVVGGETSFQEVRGYVDAHLHMMAFEFLGGRVRCGRPWHRFGVEHALVDCPDHEPNGHGAVLESVLNRFRTNPVQGHNTDGWPTFEGWPTHWSLTHEQIYYKWMERAWRGGLRMFTNLLVDNNQLCKVYPFKRNSCNEMDGVR
ncbi:MAG: hypothetical protein ACRDKT_01525, partial [Actinomycetota bacterium]